MLILRCRMFLYLDSSWVWLFCWWMTLFPKGIDGYACILIPQRENWRFVTKWRKQELGLRAVYWVSCPESFHMFFFGKKMMCCIWSFKNTFISSPVITGVITGVTVYWDSGMDALSCPGWRKLLCNFGWKLCSRGV